MSLAPAAGEPVAVSCVVGAATAAPAPKLAASEAAAIVVMILFIEDFPFA
jgi:hypothetical protein